MNILVTMDKNYIPPFRVMVCSFLANNPAERDAVFYLLHSSIPPEELEALGDYCARLGARLAPIRVEEGLFKDARVTGRYPHEMYYRLLAPHILPPEADRVLYLDPDILVINPLRPLYDAELGDNAFAAASHTDRGAAEIANGIHRLRLGMENDYFNSGVILMDTEKARKIVKTEDIFRYIREHPDGLWLPDQDIFNALYGKHTLAVDDIFWNYDVRSHGEYAMRIKGRHKQKWVVEHTAVLHFCGANKPWRTQSCPPPFGVLYKHYMTMAERVI